MPRIGAHVDQTEALTQVKARGAEIAQTFLGDPQGYKGPKVPEGIEELAPAGIDLYIHSPYLVNVATTNNRIRIPSRKLLTQHAAAAAKLGAKGLIVHGGHVLKNDDPAVGYENWRKVFERGEFELPILIENTAGGDNAMARTFDSLARLWEALDGFDVGFCLDTCHAHAAGEDLDGIVDRVRAITGRIDLVHANNSRDTFGSGADRHANIASGEIDPQAIAAVIKAADAPALVETPAEGQEDDIAYLREQLAG
ncbi:MAG: deoxyribonuclease IV [Streptosporangiales bacterium]|nr:deoxyribonuclease IV [Streptosporangiales bacterium]